MPYINLKTTKTVSAESCEMIKSAFGKAIECFPGKSEAYLMVGIEDGAKLWFRVMHHQTALLLMLSFLALLIQQRVKI